ncbi:MAG: ribonuclease HI [Thermoplasmata archaeon]
MEDRELPRGIVTAADLGPVRVHFDGACEPARGGGLATFGYTIEGAGFDLEEGGLAVRPYSERATNNVAEYAGAIQALYRLHGLGYTGPVEVRGDSQLVIRQMTGEYEVKAEHLRPYHEWLTQLAGKFSSVSWEWVPREQNQRADALSKQALADHAPLAARHRPRSTMPVGDASENESTD